MMDLDSALNELGMLSIVTESRRQYLKERTAQGPKAASSSFHIVKMNPEFVTCMGPVVHRSPQHYRLDGDARNGVVEAEKSLSASRPYPPLITNEHRVARTHRPTRRYHKKPYYVPSSSRHSKTPKLPKLHSLSASLEDDVFVDDSSTDCNANGRKYRSPSTEAVERQKEPVRKVSLHRSRSLDDLQLERLHIDDGLSRHRSDMELVSKFISNLQVS